MNSDVNVIVTSGGVTIIVLLFRFLLIRHIEFNRELIHTLLIGLIIGTVMSVPVIQPEFLIFNLIKAEIGALFAWGVVALMGSL